MEDDDHVGGADGGEPEKEGGREEGKVNELLFLKVKQEHARKEHVTQKTTQPLKPHKIYIHTYR